MAVEVAKLHSEVTEVSFVCSVTVYHHIDKDSIRKKLACFQDTAYRNEDWAFKVEAQYGIEMKLNQHLEFAKIALSLVAKGAKYIVV